MSEPSLQTSAGTIVRMLESAAFIMAEPIDPNDAPPNDAGLVAQITFDGPRGGRLDLTSSPDFAALLAANLLGVEPDEPDVAERSLGAVGEMLNIIAGALMAEFFGDRAVVRLGIPDVRRLAAPVAPEAAAERLTLLTEENHRLELTLSFAD